MERNPQAAVGPTANQAEQDEIAPAEFQGNELHNRPLNQAAADLRAVVAQTEQALADLNFADVAIHDVLDRRLGSWHEGLDASTADYRGLDSHERTMFKLGMLHTIAALGGRNCKAILDARDKLLVIDEELAQAAQPERVVCICGFAHPLRRAPDKHRADCPSRLAIEVAA